MPTRKYINNNLSMQDPTVVYMPPMRENIAYYAVEKDGIYTLFGPIVEISKVREWIKTYYFVDHMMILSKYVNTSFHYELGDYSTQP